ncbi:hypothetical protein [Jannaschia sp. LMIT008]|uniref:hypothetical protein n=1 Tax=Jannaschia maritima TaxID=3032585 RepID=UPI002811B1E0|nr:hypothetical protein [Jannaschia sp. LMIT008]
MAQLLNATDVEALRGFQARGQDGLNEYYEYLADRGYEYGNLALGVAEQNTMANASRSGQHTKGKSTRIVWRT